jgi:eukaryotic-like serine/threonine-protein kinase
MGASDKRSYEFGPFRLDPAEYVLWRDGRIVPLAPKVFETLLVLVENSGHVVDKNEIYKQVWQDAFVEETNLTKNISILRKVLSEGDGDQTYIETVPKRGYRFVFPVRLSESEPNENGSKSVASAARQGDIVRPRFSAKDTFSQIKNHSYVLVGVLGIAVVVIAAIGFGLYKFAFKKKTGIPPTSIQITRLTSSGTVSKAAISADGKWLVYVENDGDRMSLWLKQVAVPASNTQIASTTDFYQGVSISPDGNHVYYTLVDRSIWEGTLYQLPILGGTARKLLTGIVGPAAFSPDGKKIAFYRGVDDEDRLMVANPDGTGQRQLVARRGNEYLVQFLNGPSWSPDSKTLLSTMGTFTPELSMTVAAVSPEDGAITLFSKQSFQRINDIAWLADGQGVLVSAAETFGAGESSKIWQISYPSGNGQKITNDLNNYRTISLTADSNTLASVQTETLGNLWIAPMNDLAHASQITTGRLLATYPAWAPGGKVVYALNSGDNFNLYLLDPQAGTRQQLTAHSGNNYWPVVSPDGRHVVFSSDRSGVLCLWRIDIDGANPKQLTNRTSTRVSFAPDGRTIVYQSEANKATIWTIGIEGGEPRQLTRNFSAAPVYSPDGNQIVCVYAEDMGNSPTKIAIIPASGGPPLKSFPLPVGFSLPFGWTHDGKAIIYGTRRRGVTNLWLQSLEGGEPKQLTNFTSDVIHSFDVSRDGTQLVFSRGTQSSDVVLLSGIKH